MLTTKFGGNVYLSLFTLFLLTASGTRWGLQLLWHICRELLHDFVPTGNPSPPPPRPSPPVISNPCGHSPLASGAINKAENSCSLHVHSMLFIFQGVGGAFSFERRLRMNGLRGSAVRLVHWLREFCANKRINKCGQEMA